MIIRRAQSMDVNDIYEIGVECFANIWSLESIDRDIRNVELTTYYVADMEGAIAGFGGLWSVADEGQVTNIAVRKKYRRQGCGESIVRALLESCWKKGLAKVFLEVRWSNEAARQLYEKFGFSVLGTRKAYYENPTENGYTMACSQANYQRIQV